MTMQAPSSPFAAAVRQNPYPTYAQLRQEQPVYYDERHDFWALSRYADVVRAARTPEVFSSAQGIGPPKRRGLTMISNDPPMHTRLRLLVSKAFSPRTIEQLTPRIETIVNDLLDAVLAKGSFDLIEDLAIPLPVTVIAEMLGVEPERREEFKHWSDEVVQFLGYPADDAGKARYQQSWEAFKDYFSQTIEARRHTSRHDLITLLVQAQDEQDALTLIEILNFCQLLLVAGQNGFRS